MTYELKEDNVFYGKKGSAIPGNVYSQLPNKHKELFHKVNKRTTTFSIYDNNDDDKNNIKVDARNIREFIDRYMDLQDGEIQPIIGRRRGGEIPPAPVPFDYADFANVFLHEENEEENEQDVDF